MAKLRFFAVAEIFAGVNFAEPYQLNVFGEENISPRSISVEPWDLQDNTRGLLRERFFRFEPYVFFGVDRYGMNATQYDIYGVPVMLTQDKIDVHVRICVISQW